MEERVLEMEFVGESMSKGGWRREFEDVRVEVNV